MPAIKGIRLFPHGAVARLVNISTSGALVETSARLQPGWSVTLQFEGGFRPVSVESRVARSTIVAVGSDGRLNYQIGVAFKSAIELETLPEACLDRSSATDRRGPEEAAAPIVANRW